MSRDIYVALSGAQSAWDNMAGIAQNLANSKTQGYREIRTAFELAGPPGGELYATVGEVSYAQTDGNLEIDQEPTHLAIRGDGFFALEDGTFTRDGSFRLDAEGRLVTQNGVAVLSDSGPVQVELDETITVASDGTITGSKSGEIGVVSIVALSDPSPLGGNRWGGTAGDMPEETTVIQGAVEGSNVDTMRGMIEMMEATRFFEAQQKAMQVSDEARSRLNRIGGS